MNGATPLPERIGIVLLSGVGTKLDLMGMRADVDMSAPPASGTITRRTNVQPRVSQSIDSLDLTLFHHHRPQLSYRPPYRLPPQSSLVLFSFQLSLTILMHQHLVATSSTFLLLPSQLQISQSLVLIPRCFISYCIWRTCYTSTWSTSLRRFFFFHPSFWHWRPRCFISHCPWHNPRAGIWSPRPRSCRHRGCDLTSIAPLSCPRTPLSLFPLPLRPVTSPLFPHRRFNRQYLVDKVKELLLQAGISTIGF